MLLPLSGSLGACEADDSACGAAGINRISIELYRAEWPDGEYTMRVGYDAPSMGPREMECVFVLPHTGSGEAVCEEDEWPFASVSIGATVAIGIQSAPRTIELKIESPDGEMHERTISPQYRSYEVCSFTYYMGDELISLDDE